MTLERFHHGKLSFDGGLGQVSADGGALLVFSCLRYLCPSWSSLDQADSANQSSLPPLSERRGNSMRTWGTSESVLERCKKVSLAGPGYSTGEVPVPAGYVKTLVGPTEIRMHSGGLQVDVRPPPGPGLIVLSWGLVESGS